MGLFDVFRNRDPGVEAQRAASAQRQAEIVDSLRSGAVPASMRTIPLGIESSMDFTLAGTAVKIDGLSPSSDPIIATIPALEFVKLLEADVVATGIAVGAHYEWIKDWRGSARQTWMGNVESLQLSNLWELVRQRALGQLRQSAQSQGNGVLAHVNFSQMFEREGSNDVKQYLALHIVIATTIDAQRGVPIPHDIKMVVDMHAGETPLTGVTGHHQSFPSNDRDGAI